MNAKSGTFWQIMSGTEKPTLEGQKQRVSDDSEISLSKSCLNDEKTYSDLQQVIVRWPSLSMELSQAILK